MGLLGEAGTDVIVGMNELMSDTTVGSTPGLLQDKGIVLVPITSAVFPRDIGVPETIIPAPPGETDLPSIARPFWVAVKTSPSTVKTEAFGSRDIVVVPITRTEGPSETGVPEMVIPCPPGVMVVPAMEMPVGFAV